MTDVVIISGSMGAGKTTILAEASDLLRAANIPHAAIEVDALGIRRSNDRRRLPASRERGHECAPASTCEPGMFHDLLVARVDALETALNTARVDDFAVDNDGRSPTDVARDMLRHAGWL